MLNNIDIKSLWNDAKKDITISALLSSSAFLNTAEIFLGSKNCVQVGFAGLALSCTLLIPRVSAIKRHLRQTRRRHHVFHL